MTSFELTTSTGGKLRSDDLKGQVWVGSFFFTTCPGPCLTMNKALDQVQDEPGLDDVKFVSITCDPATDTLDILQQYADRFDADPHRWIFARGSLGYVQKIGTDYLKLAVHYQEHAKHAVVVDRRGKVRGYFDMTKPLDVAGLKETLQQALADSAPAAQVAADAGPPAATGETPQASGSKESGETTATEATDELPPEQAAADPSDASGA